MSVPLPTRSPAATVPVAETFTSLQGEGLLAGVPSFFIRLSGCNLRCAWCDTPFASWQPEGEAAGLDELVERARASGVRHAVITGGEPMMFGPVVELTRRLGAGRRGDEGTARPAGLGMHITIETAGTVLPAGGDGAGALPVCDLMSISPKLSTSTPRGDAEGRPDPRDPDGRWAARHEERRLNLPVLQRLLDEFGPGRRQLKFVVTEHAARDLAEIDDLLARLRGWTSGDVLLMPEGTAPPTGAHKQAVVQACLERGWRYCPRLHIDLFGHTRGT